MTRFLLADRFGFSWEDIKFTPAHIIKQYITDIEKDKKSFSGLSRNDAQKYALASKYAGIPLV